MVASFDHRNPHCSSIVADEEPFVRIIAPRTKSNSVTGQRRCSVVNMAVKFSARLRRGLSRRRTLRSNSRSSMFSVVLEDIRLRGDGHHSKLSTVSYRDENGAPFVKIRRGPRSLTRELAFGYRSNDQESFSKTKSLSYQQIIMMVIIVFILIFIALTVYYRVASDRLDHEVLERLQSDDKLGISRFST